MPACIQLNFEKLIKHIVSVLVNWIYRACVQSVLAYGMETQVIKPENPYSLERMDGAYDCEMDVYNVV